MTEHPNGDRALRLLMDGLSEVAVIMLDPRGTIVSWSPGAERLKGYAEHEILGENFAIFYPREAIASGHPRRELEAAATFGSYEEEGWRVRKDGSLFWAQIKIAALYDDDGELEGYGKLTRDLTERKQAEEQHANVLALLEMTARTDALTGLPNRRAWDEAMDRELARARRNGTPLAVAVVDLDGFKTINDAHGHRAGDRFLRQCATAWRTAIRESDLIARYGGDEFVICMPDCPSECAVDVLARLQAQTPDGATCSAGIAVWDGAETVDQLFGRADRAMYEAKAQRPDSIRIITATRTDAGPRS